MKITEKSNIAEIIKANPDTQQIFADYGLHCVGCFASEFDTIEEGCKAHGFDEDTIKELVRDLEEFILRKIKPRALARGYSKNLEQKTETAGFSPQSMS